MILVTGGTGLLGGCLLYDLIQKGHLVRALKRPSSKLDIVENIFCKSDYGTNKHLYSAIEWVEGDILDVYSLAKAMQNIEHVYHCAALVSYLPTEAELMMKVNSKGTENVVNMALEASIEKLCYVSSVATLGRPENGKNVDENNPWDTSSHHSAYSLSKYLAEREVWRGIAEGLNAVIVNPSIIIGYGDWNESSAAIFRQAWNGLKFYTEGITGFVDVRDVSKAMIELMQSKIKNERFILSSENIPFKDLFEEIALNFDKAAPSFKITPFLSEIGWRIEKARYLLGSSKPLITKETARAAHLKTFYSNEKIRNTIGMEFITVKKSLKETCEWYIKKV